MIIKLLFQCIAKYALLFAVLYTASYNSHAQKRSDSFLQLQPYHQLPLTAIKPKGWLRDQLETMRDGTTGHLDEVYAKVKNDNGWLGGRGDGWEETPYWLDGAVPLAYLLDDRTLKDKVLRYIN